MANTRPHVSAAFLCEKVLKEENGVFSAIRIVDTFRVREPPSSLPPNVKEVLPLTAFVGLKSGDLAGSYEVVVALRAPSGKRREVGKWPIVLKGGEHGFNLTINLQIEVRDLGLYWFDVLWQGDVLTSIPFKLERARSTAQAAPPEAS